MLHQNWLREIATDGGFDRFQREKGTEKRKSTFCGCKTYGLGCPLGLSAAQRQEVSIHKSWALSTVFGIKI